MICALKMVLNTLVKENRQKTTEKAMNKAKVIKVEGANFINKISGEKENPKSGEPFANSWWFFNHSSGNFKVGTWDCTSGSWEHNHPAFEFCYIVEGRVKIAEKDGPTHTFNTGDSFVVPKGARVTWIVEEYAKKIFVSASNLEVE